MKKSEKQKGAFCKFSFVLLFYIIFLYGIFHSSELIRFWASNNIGLSSS